MVIYNTSDYYILLCSGYNIENYSYITNYRSKKNAKHHKNFIPDHFYEKI